MRTGYAIRDRSKRGWLKTRYRVAPEEPPITVYVKAPDHALTFHRLRDARQMARQLRKDSPQPAAIQVVSPKWEVVG